MTVVAICFALIKVRIIMREFMEVRGAPLVLRRLTDFWVLLMAVALLGVYSLGKRWPDALVAPDALSVGGGPRRPNLSTV